MSWRAELKEPTPGSYEGWLVNDDGPSVRWATGIDVSCVLRDTLTERDRRNGEPIPTPTYKWVPDPDHSFVVPALSRNGVCYVAVNDDNAAFFVGVDEDLDGYIVVKPEPIVLAKAVPPTETIEEAIERLAPGYEQCTRQDAEPHPNKDGFEFLALRRESAKHVFDKDYWAGTSSNATYVWLRKKKTYEAWCDAALRRMTADLAKTETREEATARFQDFWKEKRPQSFLEAFLEGARVK